MDKRIREAQKEILAVFANEASDFALAGGTALELYYLYHRFSADLDFLSPKYDKVEIKRLVSAFKRHVNYKIKLETEFVASEKAKVCFYTAVLKGSKRPLKIDFAEDVFFKKPNIQTINGVRLYSAKNIYFQKITAISGVRSEIDQVGREIMHGRNQARDVFDLYMLSKKIQPLHIFLNNISAQLQRGMIHWYRTFSRQELKLALLDLEIYNKKFDSKEMIIYLEDEIKQFMRGVIDEYL